MAYLWRLPIKRLLLTVIMLTCLIFSTTALAQEPTTFAAITAANAAQLKWQRMLGLGHPISAAWSTDGETLFSVTTTGVYRYDPADPNAVPIRVSGNIASTRNAFFSPEGQWLATTSDELRITNLATGDYWTALKDPDGGWYKVFFSNTLVIALSSSSRLWIYDVQQKRVVRVVNDLFDLALRPDGQQFAVTDQRGIGLWSLDPLQEIGRFSPRLNNAVRLRFSPDGKTLFTLRIGYTLAAYDVATRRIKYQVPQSNGNSLLYAAQGNVTLMWSNSRYNTPQVQVIDLDTGGTTFQLKVTGANAEGNVAVTRVALSRDGSRAATVSFDNILRVWSTTTGKLLDEQTIAETPFLLFTPDGSKLLYPLTSTLTLYDYTAHTSETLSGRYGDNSYDVLFSPDGQQLATFGANSIIRFWQTHAWDVVTDVRVHTTLYRVNDMSYSPNSRRLLIATDKQVLLYDLPINGGKHEIDAFTTLGKLLCRSSAYSPDGKWMACNAGGKTIRIWDAATKRLVWDYSRDTTGDKDSFNGLSVAFSPDSQQLAISLPPERIDIVNMRDFSVQEHIFKTKSTLYALTYSPDGTLLAAKDVDNVVHVFDARTMQLKWFTRGLYRDYGDARQVVAFSPDGSLIAVTDQDQQIRLFEAATGKLVADIKPNASDEGDYTIRGLAFNPDGTLLAGTTGMGVVMLWGIAEK